MITKPLTLIFVYLICCINILLILTPFLAIILPFINYQHFNFNITNNIQYDFTSTIFLFFFIIYFLMLLYFILDYLFGFSARASLVNCKKYDKYKDYDFLTPVLNQIKEKFNENSVKLFIKNSDEINAYAVGSLGCKYIIVSRGLIERFLILCPEPKLFLNAIRSVIAHEMSHLINKDYLLTYIIIVNQKITNIVSRFLQFLFYKIIYLSNYISYNNKISYFFMLKYNFINKIITFFNSFIIYNIYSIWQKFVSRSIEYRSDYQASKAFGGKNLALALNMLGTKGYFTIFSSHPKTKNRIKKIENIKNVDGYIGANFVDMVVNYLFMLFFIIIFLLLAKLAKIDIIIRNLLQNHDAIYQKLSFLWHLIQKIY
jgi:Zn-dependent protease with chaperone function